MFFRCYECVREDRWSELQKEGHWREIKSIKIERNDSQIVFLGRSWHDYYVRIFYTDPCKSLNVSLNFVKYFNSLRII